MIKNEMIKCSRFYIYNILTLRSNLSFSLIVISKINYFLKHERKILNEKSWNVYI